MNPIKALCFLTVLLMASAPLALAQGTYTQIDPVGSTATFCFGINATGDIAGAYADVNSPMRMDFFLVGISTPPSTTLVLETRIYSG